MIALAFVLGSALAAAVVGLVALLFKLSSAKSSEVLAVRLVASVQHDLDGIREDRNHWKTTCDVRDVEIVELKRRLEATEDQRNEAAAAAAQRVVEKIKTAGLEDAIKTVNEMLGTDIRRR